MGADAREHRRQIERECAPDVRSWSADPYTLTAGAVCASCNNRWMSELEQRAQQLLEPMLHGRGRQLHRGGQRTLAAWALKTALMVEQSFSPGRRIIGEREHDHLYVHGQPSDDVRVWMASYDGEMPAFAHMQGADADVTQDDERGVRDLYSVTLTLGPVAFQVFGTTVPGLLDIVELRQPPLVHRIWPFDGSFIWAPRPALDDAG